MEKGLVQLAHKHRIPDNHRGINVQENFTITHKFKNACRSSMQKRHQFKFSSIAFTFYFWSKTLHVIDFKFQETKISVEFPSFFASW